MDLSQYFYGLSVIYVLLSHKYLSFNTFFPITCMGWAGHEAFMGEVRSTDRVLV